MTTQSDFSTIRIGRHIQAAREDALQLLSEGRQKRVAAVYELGNQNNSLPTTADGAVRFANELACSIADETQDDAFFFSNIRNTVRRIRRLIS